ncbi:MAG: response regulator [Syntrophomonas sp.]
MEVVLIGSMREELQSIAELMKDMDAVKRVSAFDRLVKAREYCEGHQVDLVLLDADDEDPGWAISYRKIKAIDGNARVVLMSRNEAAAVKAHESGVWDYLLKPVKKKQLIRVLEKADFK